MTPQGSSDAQAATAAAPSARHVQGQFDDAEQDGGSGEEYDPEFEAENGGRRRRQSKRKKRKSGNKKKTGERK